MKIIVTLDEGWGTYEFDFESRTVTMRDGDESRDLTVILQTRLDIGTQNPMYVGIGVDEFAGLQDSWDGSPDNAIALLQEMGVNFTDVQYEDMPDDMVDDTEPEPAT